MCNTNDHSLAAAAPKGSERVKDAFCISECFGKVLVCGGYLVLDEENQGLVLSLPSASMTTICTSGSLADGSNYEYANGRDAIASDACEDTDLIGDSYNYGHDDAIESIIDIGDNDNQSHPSSSILSVRLSSPQFYNTNDDHTCYHYWIVVKYFVDHSFQVYKGQHSNDKMQFSKVSSVYSLDVSAVILSLMYVLSCGYEMPKHTRIHATTLTDAPFYIDVHEKHYMYIYMSVYFYYLEYTKNV